MKIRVGLPKTTGYFPKVASCMGAPILVSANSLFNHKLKKFKEFGWNQEVYYADIALDSAGFVAMARYGGYPWTMEQYVDMVATQSPSEISRVSHSSVPWSWWASMDFCCEPEVAADRVEVNARIDRTVTMYSDTLDYVDWWRHEGMTDLSDPMPTLQGWTPEDYRRSLDLMGPIWERRYAPDIAAEELEYKLDIEEARRDLNQVETEEERSAARQLIRRIEKDRDEGLAQLVAHPRVPPLVGIGSVCRRPLHGPTGLLAVLGELEPELPRGIQLHLFGVKGAAMPHLAQLPIIASVDSLAWDFRASEAARETFRRTGVNPKKTNEFRARYLVEWYRRQRQRLGREEEGE